MNELEATRNAMRRLEDQGYEVVESSEVPDLPFDLADYRPDFIVRRGGEYALVEVKQSAARISIDRLMGIAREVADHPGWRLMLVPAEPSEDDEIDRIPSWSAIRKRVEDIDPLVEQGALVPALLYGWAVLESAMRRRAFEAALPVERLAGNLLLKHMYSNGEMSMSQYDRANRHMKLRNRAAHGADVNVSGASVRDLLQLLRVLVHEWEVMSNERTL